MMGREYEDFLHFFTSPSERKDALPETFNLGAILAAIIGVSCLAYVVLMCVCSGQKKTKDVKATQLSHKTDKTSVVARNGAESRIEIVGGRTSLPPDAISSLQANQMPANSRASMVRLLPAPPVSSYETVAKQPSGPELSSSGFKHGGHISGMAAQNNQQLHGKSIVPSSVGRTKMSGTDMDYEHLGPKSVIMPSDYDSLNELKSHERQRVPSESSESSDNDYSELDDKTYPEVIEVSSKRKELSDPYSKIKDEVELKEEDPYNHIGDSGGTVSTQVIQQLKQTSRSHAGDSNGSVSAAVVSQLKQLREQDDPYATVQDGSDGTIKNVLRSGAVTQEINHHNATGTADDAVEEYAIIHKTKGEAKHTVGDQEQGSEDKEFSPYGISPPEPPRLYTVLDVEEDAHDIPKHKTKYKYSQITARESLASMSARTSENPYESLPDTLENTYTPVEGSLVEEIETGHRAGGLGANRVSQISDTYAEIGISGGSVKYNNVNNHLEDNKKIVSTTTASLLHPVNRANGQHIYSNSSQPRQKYIASAGVSGGSSNRHENIPEYEDSADTYVTLNEDSSLLSLSAAQSQGIPHLSNSLTIQGQGSGIRTVQEVKGYEDYEEVGETNGNVVHSKPGLAGNTADASVEHKKVGQRRKMLHHK